MLNFQRRLYAPDAEAGAGSIATPATPPADTNATGTTSGEGANTPQGTPSWPQTDSLSRVADDLNKPPTDPKDYQAWAERIQNRAVQAERQQSRYQKLVELQGIDPSRAAMLEINDPSDQHLLDGLIARPDDAERYGFVRQSDVQEQPPEQPPEPPPPGNEPWRELLPPYYRQMTGPEYADSRAYEERRAQNEYALHQQVESLADARRQDMSHKWQTDMESTITEAVVSEALKAIPATVHPQAREFLNANAWAAAMRAATDRGAPFPTPADARLAAQRVLGSWNAILSGYRDSVLNQFRQESGLPGEAGTAGTEQDLYEIPKARRSMSGGIDVDALFDDHNDAARRAGL